MTRLALLAALATLVALAASCSTNPQFLFNGATYLTAPSSTDLGGKSFSWSVWIKRTVTPHSGGSEIAAFAHGLVSAPDSMVVVGWIPIGSAGDDHAAFRYAHWGDDLTSSTFTSQEYLDWHFFAGTFDHVSRERKLYMDGTLLAQDVATGDYVAGARPFYVARHATNRHQGYLDEMHFYERVLSAAEISSQFSTREYDLTGLLFGLSGEMNSATEAKDHSGRNFHFTSSAGLTADTASPPSVTCPSYVSVCANVACTAGTDQTTKCYDNNGVGACDTYYNQGASCGGSSIIADDGSCLAWSPETDFATRQLHRGDLNGDGLEDIALAEPTKIYMWVASGSQGGAISYNTFIHNVPNGWNFDGNWNWDSTLSFSGDVDGDGCTDLFRWGANRPANDWSYVHIWMSKCDGGPIPQFDAVSAWTTNWLASELPNDFYGTDQPTIAPGLGMHDLDGSGRMSFVRATTSTIYSLIPTGTCNYHSGMNQATVATCFTEAEFAVVTTHGTPDWYAGQHMWGDFNGDGMEDLVYAYATQYQFYISKGDGTYFTPSVAYTGKTFGTNLESYTQRDLFDIDTDSQSEFMRTDWASDLFYIFSAQSDDATCWGVDGVRSTSCLSVTTTTWPTGWGFTGVWSFNSPNFVRADVNGDGRYDYIRLGGPYGHYFVSKNDTSRTMHHPVLHFQGHDFTTQQTPTTWRPLVLDPNGDGIEDVARISTTQVYTLAHTGDNTTCFYSDSTDSNGDCYTITTHTAPISNGFADSASPTASAPTPADVTAEGGTSFTLVVTFSDDVAIDLASLDIGDVRLVQQTGGSYSETAVAFSMNSAVDTAPLEVTYTFTPPGGAWDASDSGTYRVELQAIEVSDTVGNAVAATNFATFTVAADSTPPVISPISIASNNTDTTQAETGDLVTVTFTSDEALASATVTIAGRAATVSNNGLDYTATLVVAAGDPTGTVAFSIVATDASVEANEATETATTDSSSVTRVCSEYELGDTCSCSSVVQGTVTEGTTDLILYTETDTPPTWTRFEDDRLYIVYDESIWYSAVTRSFNNTDGLCSQHWTWSSTDNEPSCTRTWEGWANWADVIADCEFERATANNDISYTTNFAVTVSETVPALRGGPVTRTVKHNMPFQLSIPTRVTANASDIVAFSPVVEIGAIVEQTLKGTPGTDISMDVSFLTSVQWPFVLKSATWGAITADDNGAPDAFSLETTAGSCDDNNATEPNCQNTWSSTVYPASQTTTCELDGQYTVNWVVDCHDSVKASNDCPIDTATDDATLTFTIDTSSFCVQVADTVTLSAAIYTYEDAAHTILKDDFLDGQTVYAEVPTSSDKVSIDSTRVVDATIVRVTEANIGLIADGDVVLPNDYAVARVDGGSSAAGVSSRPSFQFTVNTASTHMNLSDDSSETMTLAATVAVRYQNAGQAAFSKVRYETALQTKEKDVGASTSVGFGGTQSTTTTGTTSAASSEATIMGVNAMVVYGAGAIMALVLITAYVVLRRSDPTPTVNKSESQVQLTSTAGAGETSEERV